MGLDFWLIDCKITRQVTLSHRQYNILPNVNGLRHFFVEFRSTTGQTNGVRRKAKRHMGVSREVSTQNVKSEANTIQKLAVNHVTLTYGCARSSWTVQRQIFRDAISYRGRLASSTLRATTSFYLLHWPNYEQQHTRPRNITAAAFVAQQIRDDDCGRHRRLHSSFLYLLCILTVLW